MTVNGLGLDREKTIAYLKSDQPTYPQFERWVAEQNGGHIRPRTSTHNATIAGYIHGDSTGRQSSATPVCRTTAPSGAVSLNKLRTSTNSTAAGERLSAWGELPGDGTRRGVGVRGRAGGD